jgi:hypothetical protein
VPQLSEVPALGSTIHTDGRRGAPARHGRRACASVEATRIREQGLLRLAQANGWNGEPFQAGLFDRRALKEHAAALQSHAAALDAAVDRLGQIAAARTISVADCEPELVLVITD